MIVETDRHKMNSGVTSLMYVGDTDTAIDRPTPRMMGVGAIGLALAVFGSGTLRLAGLAAAAFVAGRATRR